MTDRARELLYRALSDMTIYNDLGHSDGLMEEISAYLAEPEVKPLSASKAYLDGLAPEWRKRNTYTVSDVLWGIRFAEQHHGIGDNNENPNT